MKAAQLVEYGGEDAIKLSDVDEPAVNKDQVLVEVYAAALNPFDYKVREGYMKEFIPLELPVTLGSDVAGKVVKLGSEVSGFDVGQEVYGMAGAVSGNGSFAEFAPVLASQLVSKPKSVDFVVAAALPLAAVSAYQALVDHMGLQKGQKVLIHGGGGGIGSLGIQIAHNIGAYIATTVGSKDIDYAKTLGADEVIDYKDDDFTAMIDNYDAVFDTVGGETNTKSYGVLRSGGIMVSMTSPADETLVAQYEIKYIQEWTQPTPERLRSIADMVDDGKLVVNIDKVFDLDQTAEALEYLKMGHPRGKVVLSIKT